jgi:hypothetical protein
MIIFSYDRNLWNSFLACKHRRTLLREQRHLQRHVEKVNNAARYDRDRVILAGIHDSLSGRRILTYLGFDIARGHFVTRRPRICQ